MKIVENFVVYPEGDTQQIPHTLSINAIVDLNGYPLPLPLPTPKMIAYRVYKVRTEELKGETNTYHHLELLHREDIIQYIR